MRLISLFCLCLFFQIAGCNKEKDYPPLSKDNINAEKLWKRIAEQKNYKQYPFWPGHKGIRRGQSPHADLHRIYINSILRKTLPNTNKLAPEGSIIVKEGLDNSKKLDSLTVMAKVKHFNPKGNDWFWAKYDKNGNVVVSGKLKPCISCHSAVKNNDYIMIRDLDKALKEKLENEKGEKYRED